jgi:hypothetical protein
VRRLRRAGTKSLRKAFVVRGWQANPRAVVGLRWWDCLPSLFHHSQPTQCVVSLHPSFCISTAVSLLAANHVVGRPVDFEGHMHHVILRPFLNPTDRRRAADCRRPSRPVRGRLLFRSCDWMDLQSTASTPHPRPFTPSQRVCCPLVNLLSSKQPSQTDLGDPLRCLPVAAASGGGGGDGGGTEAIT